jgi:putative heme degradation protein
MKAVFAVEAKVPNSDDSMLSIQFFDANGASALKAFHIRSMQEEADDNFDANRTKLNSLIEKLIINNS